MPISFKYSYFRRSFQNDGVTAIGKRPYPKMVESIRDRVYETYNTPLILKNIRVLCESIKHVQNAELIIQMCSNLGVRNLSFSKNSIDPFIPPVLESTDLGNLNRITKINLNHFFFNNNLILQKIISFKIILVEFLLKIT